MPTIDGVSRIFKRCAHHGVFDGCGTHAVVIAVISEKIAFSGGGSVDSRVRGRGLRDKRARQEWGGVRACVCVCVWRGNEKSDRFISRL